MPTSPPASGSWPYPGEDAYYPSGTTDPVRANALWTPVELIANPNRGLQVSVIGVVGLAGVLLLMEHFRLRAGRR